MASVVQICNMALSHIGSDAIVTSIDPPDGSIEAGHCVRFYDLARTSMLEAGHWSFGRKRVELAEVTNDSIVWSYAYALPADCLRPQIVLRLAADNVFQLETFTLSELKSADYEVEGQVLRTNEPEAVLLYTIDITDTTRFTPSFTSALAFMLASYLAGPIVKGNEGARLGDAMRERAMAEARASASINANASSTRAEHTAGYLVART